MQIHFLYLTLQNGICFYHHIDPEMPDLQEELLGGLISAFQMVAKKLFKSNLSEIRMEEYTIIIRQFILQDTPMFLILGMDPDINSPKLKQLTNNFINILQSLLTFYQVNFDSSIYIGSEFKQELEKIYFQLQEKYQSGIVMV